MWGLREKVCSDWCNITKENCYWKKCIRCQQALEMMCSGHAMDIYDISWCPNSEFIVSSGTDSNVIIWGIDGAQYNRIHEHTGYIQGIDWSQDDATIVSVANDRTARVYSYAKGHGNACLQIDDPTAVPALRTEHRISKNIVNNKPMLTFACDTTELTDPFVRTASPGVPSTLPSSVLPALLSAPLPESPS